MTPLRLALLALLAVLLPACREKQTAIPAAEPIIRKDVGFSTPESVLHDPLTDLLFVSNINGSPVEADDNGFISVLSAEGEILNLKAIDGASDSVTLNAPKGLAVTGEDLFVTDISTIRRFHRRTGAPLGDRPIPGATFLNDITVGPDGALYFTDSGLRMGAGGFEPSGTDAIYRIHRDGRLDTLASGPELGNPNGIAVTGDSVWVVSGAGELYRVVDGRKTGAVRLPRAQLDGLVAVNGEMFISSWDGRTVYRGPVGGPFRELLRGLESPADIGHDQFRHRILIPLFSGNEVRLVPLAP